MDVNSMSKDIRSSEAWRPVVGFESLYAVSAYGEVFSFRADRRLKARPDKDGYPRLVLRVNGVYHTKRVHRLVAEAFHGDKKNALHNQVDHIDGNRANADADNLRWVSCGENHFFRRGSPSAVKEMLSPLNEDQVRAIRATPKRWGSATVLAEQLGVPRMAVYDVLRGRTWRSVT